MTLHEYRVETTALTFAAYGRLEHVEGIHVLRLRVAVDQALAMQADLNASKPFAVFATAAGELVLPAMVHKCKARPDGGRVDVACLLLQ